LTDWSRMLCACWLLEAILLNRSLSTHDLGFESRADPRQLQDWILKCLHGGRGQALALWGSDQLSVRSVSRKASTRTRTGKCSQSATCERVDVPRLAAGAPASTEWRWAAWACRTRCSARYRASWGARNGCAWLGLALQRGVQLGCATLSNAPPLFPSSLLATSDPPPPRRPVFTLFPPSSPGLRRLLDGFLLRLSRRMMLGDVEVAEQPQQRHHVH
jgi:hypothetical protein